MLQRCVDGVMVDCSPEEEAAQRAEWAANDSQAATRREAATAVAYRRARAVAYRDELGEETGDFINTLGDVLDVIIRELRARGPAETREFADMTATIDAIKARHAKPA